ncbi:MAG: secondary thiamine-phosphate synthase enzyme YjbQ [Alteraurantiacibacter sp.]
MPHHAAQLTIATTPRSLTEITREVAQWLAATHITTGLVTVFCRHTSASLLITENASSAVWRDVLAWLDRQAPEGPLYEHDDEGGDDMPAHLKAVLTGASVQVPVLGGRLMLGTWQGIFLAEHRAAPHRRNIVLQCSGD